MKPKAQLLHEMNPALVANIKRRGLFRCGVVVPDCTREPVGQLGPTKLRGSKKGIHRLFCQKHMHYFCQQYGVPEPAYVSGTN
jgi:hypothetical protein